MVHLSVYLLHVNMYFLALVWLDSVPLKLKQLPRLSPYAVNSVTTNTAPVRTVVNTEYVAYTVFSSR